MLCGKPALTLILGELPKELASLAVVKSQSPTLGRYCAEAYSCGCAWCVALQLSQLGACNLNLLLQGRTSSPLLLIIHR
jgi:hypothetical protein